MMMGRRDSGCHALSLMGLLFSCDHGEFSYRAAGTYLYRSIFFCRIAINDYNMSQKYLVSRWIILHVKKSCVVRQSVIFEVNRQYSRSQMEFFQEQPTQAFGYVGHSATQISRRNLRLALSCGQIIQGVQLVQGPLDHCTHCKNTSKARLLILHSDYAYASRRTTMRTSVQKAID